MDQVVYAAIQSDKAAVRKLGIDTLVAALRSLSPEAYSQVAAPHMQSISLCMPTHTNVQHLSMPERAAYSLAGVQACRTGMPLFASARSRASATWQSCCGKQRSACKVGTAPSWQR